MAALPTDRCSSVSESLEEPLLATASTVRSWLLLEHPGPWGRQGLLDGRLPGGLGRELRRRGRRHRVRVLLIRRTDRRRAAGVACFAIRSGPEAPRIERTELARVEDVLDLDLAPLGRGRRLGLAPAEGPLFLVCTHGRRDPCCAERGRPLASAVASAFGEETWESTHVGGDRFAGNLLAFPHGLYFGRVPAAGGPDVARAYAQGMIALAHYRGRSCHPMDVQAAEHLLRTSRGLDGVDDVLPAGFARRGPELAATFTTPRGAFVVRVRCGRSAPHLLTCHSAAEETAPTYELVGIEPARHPRS